MSILSINDASCMAGVSRQSLTKKIESGEIKCSDKGIDVAELIRVYPNLKPLANLKIRTVKSTPELVEPTLSEDAARVHMDDVADQQLTSTGTVELLIRELKWNKELLEQTNQLMAKQLADQRALIADQARRLDEKDRFWARQVEIAQSLLPAPPSQKRRKIFGIF